MKKYNEFEKRFIGASDIATLILVGLGDDGMDTASLCFGTDGAYFAYIVDGPAEIGSHYKKVAEFKKCLKIYDDDSLAASFRGEKITVYRAAEMGCIIKITD